MSPLSVIFHIQYIVVDPLSHVVSIGTTVNNTIIIQRLDK